MAITLDARELSLVQVMHAIDRALGDGVTEIELAVVDPGLAASGTYAGEPVHDLDGRRLGLHRGYALWTALATAHGLQVRRVRATPEGVRITLCVLDREARLEPALGTARHERYGSGSPARRARKAEDPRFLRAFADALASLALPEGAAVLDLGAGAGEEIELAWALAPATAAARWVAIDHSASAIAEARARLGDRVELHCADFANLAKLGLGRFDLIMAIASLQSSAVDDRALLRQLVADHATRAGAFILALPNCRYLDGEVDPGARVVNRREPELGILIKDAAFYRKYFQQHGYQVRITGDHYWLVTATRDAASARGRATR